MIKTFDKRVVKKFTLFLKLLDDGNKVWFSFYYSKQYFGITINSPKFNPSEGNMMASPRLSECYWVEYYTYK